MTRARDLAGIFNSTVAPTAMYAEHNLSSFLTEVDDGENVNGGVVSGILGGYIYSIINEEQNNTYNGGTV